MTGTQTSPASPILFVVTADSPRHHSGTPYLRTSPMSVATPSMITPASFATLHA